MPKRNSQIIAFFLLLMVALGMPHLLAQATPDIADLLNKPLPVVLPGAESSDEDNVVVLEAANGVDISFHSGAGEVTVIDPAEEYSATHTQHYAPGVPVPHSVTQVSVLGYHDFGHKAPTEMKMRVSDFRTQMQRIKDSGATVITLQDYLAWKSGAKQLPARCILITLDDGWKSVYTEAYPILKEYGFPFTLFLYTRYVDSGGASQSWAMVKEMMKNGASIGSHSTSHPYPKDYRREKKKGDESFIRFLQKEIADSKKVLEENLGVVVEAYCFPGGYKTPEMFTVLEEAGYKAAFDVLPGKVVSNTKDLEVPRYMVLGNKLGTFEGSLSFGGGKSGRSQQSGVGRPQGTVPTQPVSPRANALLTLGLHPIAIDLSNEGNIDPGSISMRVSGVGRVMGVYDPRNKTYSWKPNRLMRGTVTVQVSWRKIGESRTIHSVEWQFKTTEFVVEPPPPGWIP